LSAPPQVQQKVAEGFAKRSEKSQEAAQELAGHIGADFERRLGAQQQAIGQIAQSYGVHLREQMTQWGCNAACTTQCTSNPGLFMTCGACECPERITVTWNMQ